jgi:transcriptional regulator GlxA family with amidase domain
MDRRIKKILELLQDEGLGTGLISSALPKEVNLSRSGFYRIFKADMKTSPARYAKVKRMEAAARLLETTYLSVKQVGAQVGFHDQSHFVRDFKKQYGHTPTEYRDRKMES